MGCGDVGKILDCTGIGDHARDIRRVLGEEAIAAEGKADLLVPNRDKWGVGPPETVPATTSEPLKLIMTAAKLPWEPLYCGIDAWDPKVGETGAGVTDGGAQPEPGIAIARTTAASIEVAIDRIVPSLRSRRSWSGVRVFVLRSIPCRILSPVVAFSQ